MQRLTLTLLTCFLVYGIQAQNLEIVGKEKPFKMNGGISVNQVGYLSNDTISQRDPYTYYLNGNLNFNIYGWSVPFTFSYTNQKLNYTQPFNQYSLHPTYKWIRMHLGYTSMSFSPYTLNGHLFLGGGIECAPEAPFTISAMYGRLRRAVEFDSLAINPSPPEFERWGYGMNGTYTLSPVEAIKATIGFTVFHASDKPGSLEYLLDSMAFPGENLVISTNLEMTVAGGFSFTGEIASSAVTQNTESVFTDEQNVKWSRFMGTLIGSNATTEYFSAKRLNFGYTADFYSVGVGYERIDPGYNTYGAYYFQNDMENITVNGSLMLFENKLSLGANVGKQRDNLDDSKASEMKRWITAFNAGYNSGEKLSLNISYSTFTSFMNIRSQFDYINQITPYDNLDTLDYTQLSATTSANVSYILKNTDDRRQNLNFNLSYQKASDLQGDTEVEGGSRFYNMSIAYGHSIVPLSLTITGALNANINRSPGMESSTFGPTVAINKMMLDKKLRNSLSCSFNQAQANGNVQSRVLSFRLSSSYRLGKHHNFNLGLTNMNRKTNIQEDPRSISELVATLGYSYVF